VSDYSALPSPVFIDFFSPPHVVVDFPFYLPAPSAYVVDDRASHDSAPSPFFPRLFPRGSFFQIVLFRPCHTSQFDTSLAPPPFVRITLLLSPTEFSFSRADILLDITQFSIAYNRAFFLRVLKFFLYLSLPSLRLPCYSVESGVREVWEILRIVFLISPLPTTGSFPFFVLSLFFFMTFEEDEEGSNFHHQYFFTLES